MCLRSAARQLLGTGGKLRGAVGDLVGSAGKRWGVASRGGKAIAELLAAVLDRVGTA